MTRNKIFNFHFYNPPQNKKGTPQLTMSSLQQKHILKILCPRRDARLCVPYKSELLFCVVMKYVDRFFEFKRQNK